MKVAPVVGLLFVVGLLELAQARPMELSKPEKSKKDASVYILGSLYNAAVSHNYSKSQAASDRNESEWNSTEMLNGVSKNPNQEEMEGRRGDAANLAIAYQGSESQAAENDQKSGYNNQNLGMGVEGEENEEDMEDEKKK